MNYSSIKFNFSTLNKYPEFIQKIHRILKKVTMIPIRTYSLSREHLLLIELYSREGNYNYCCGILITGSLPPPTIPLLSFSFVCTAWDGGRIGTETNSNCVSSH